MPTYTPSLMRRWLLGGAALLAALGAQAQTAPRYVFPNTPQGSVLALPTRQVLLASAATGSPVLRLHWLNAQGDTVRGRRLRVPGVSGLRVRSITTNAYTGTALLDCGSRAVLLSAQGDTLWTRQLAVPASVTGAPDGGFVGLDTDTHPTQSVLTAKWVKLSAAGQKVQEVFLPLVGATYYAVASGIVPAVGGYWAVTIDLNTAGGRNTSRAVHIDEAGVIGTQHTLSGNALSRVAALPNFAADGYWALSGAQLQRYSPNWTPQLAAPVAAYDGLRTGPDGNALVFSAGPYARIPEAPLNLDVALGQVTPQGQRLHAAVVDQHPGYDGRGLDVAKNTTGSLLVHTVARSTGTNVPTLLVYALPTAALPTRARAEAPALAVYPQPATEAVTIRSAGLRGHISLLDGLSRVVRQHSVAPGATEQQLPLQGLAPGIYVLRATDKAGQQLRARISKQ
jgi:hypothetical protein